MWVGDGGCYQVLYVENNVLCSVLFCPHLAGGVPGCCEGVLLLSKKIKLLIIISFVPLPRDPCFCWGRVGEFLKPHHSPPPPTPSSQIHHWLKRQEGHGSILVPIEQCMCNFCHNYQKLQEELIGLHTPDQMFQLRTCLIISLPRLQFLLLHLLICLHNTLVMKIQGLVSNITCIQPIMYICRSIFL